MIIFGLHPLRDFTTKHLSCTPCLAHYTVRTSSALAPSAEVPQFRQVGRVYKLAQEGVRLRMGQGGLPTLRGAAFRAEDQPEHVADDRQHHDKADQEQDKHRPLRGDTPGSRVELARQFQQSHGVPRIDHR